MMKEEHILFPYIATLENAVSNGRPRPRPPFGTVSNPVHMMELEHDSAGAALKEISTLSSNYEPPEGACFSYRTLVCGAERVRDRSASAYSPGEQHALSRAQSRWRTARKTAL